jgi:hypothetical protein
MNMSYPNSEPSMPEDAVAAYGRLRAFLEEEKQTASNVKVYNTPRLFDVAGQVPSPALIRALARLVTEGLIDQVVRVEPRYGEGIGDFSSIEDVPDEIEDWRHPGTTVRVRPEHLQVYYKLHPDARQ